MIAITEKQKARFWSKVQVQEVGCWLWQGAPNGDGYGTLSLNNRTITAHRISWELANGAIPDGLCVLHTCDNRMCVNPDHLFLGTRLDNNRDRADKGRNGRTVGTKNPNVVLTDEHVAEIRRRYKKYSRNNDNLIRLAEEFGVHLSTISQIVRGKTWK